MARNVSSKPQALIDAHEQWVESLDDLIDSDGSAYDFTHDSERNPDGSPFSSDLASFCCKADIAGVVALLDAHPLADVNDPGVYNENPLHTAICSGELQCCELFLARGSRIHGVDSHGYSALNLAISNPLGRSVSSEMIHLLVAHGAPLEDVGPFGLTPFLLACRSLNLGAAQALLKLGAKPDAMSLLGYGAVSIAQKAVQLLGIEWADAPSWGVWPQLRASHEEKTAEFMVFLHSVFERAELDLCAAAVSCSKTQGRLARTL